MGVTITPSAPVNTAPTDILLSNASVQEFRANGTVVGAFSAVDTVGNTFTYSLLNNAGGRFSIVGNQLQVANGLLFDFEQAPSHQIQVKVTDQGGLSYIETMTINVTNVDPEVITGDAANNTFVGGAYNDVLAGGLGHDVLNGQNGVDVLYGGAGNDTLYGGNQNDYLFGDADHDVLYGGTGDDYMVGGLGNDRLYGDIGNDRMSGDDGVDVLYGGAGTDVLSGGNQNDTLYGEADNDILYGGAGDDYLRGGDGNDTLFGQDGNDRLYGDAGNDYLQGGNQNDRMDGGAGTDVLYGYAGNDVLKGGDGCDTLYGGLGADQFVLDKTSIDRIKDFNKSQGDKLNISDLLTGFGAGDDIDDFVCMLSFGNNTYVAVNADGVGYDFKFAAILEGVRYSDPDQLGTSLITNTSVII